MMVEEEQRHVRERGRPREKLYHKFAEFLREFEELKKDYLFRREIVKALYGAVWKKLEKIDLGGHSANGYEPLLKTRYHGDTFRCTTCGKESPGEDFTIDEDHHPPRILFRLECGHRQDVAIPTKMPTQCPKCGGQIQKDERGLAFCINWPCEWSESESVN